MAKSLQLLYDTYQHELQIMKNSCVNVHPNSLWLVKGPLKSVIVYTVAIQMQCLCSIETPFKLLFDPARCAY